MAVASRGRAELTSKTSPERTMVWTEPKRRAKAQVVYYLSRNGNLEQPHFVEVPFSTVEGLYLRDVISRLHVLRGRAMADMYSWSCKRSYRNGYVWHDLLEDDFIHPVHRNEYVLKGTRILDFYFSSIPSASVESSASSSISSGKSVEASKRAQDDTFVSSTVKSSDASTQTDEHRRHRRRATPTDEKPKTLTTVENPATELSQDEISPPPLSSSSPETLEALIKADNYRIVAAEPEQKGRAEGGCLSGRVKATEVLMHLISCGSASVRTSGLSLMPQYSGGLDRAESMGHFPSFRAMRVEEVCFSGSLVETNKPAAGGNGDEMPSLKRSSSYNADRGSEMDDLAKENEEVRGRCVPRKPKSRNEGRTHK
ncbi:protein SOSEKI 5-like isoform X1 [Zingiber officinale]|uniref:protein SOSEKI 5-like isoform X1 n=1 Tax=Zingiber officinale TaxID=94328 RepID=UPI001C4B0D4B|nr:protein SOSEKI 5-like isoform X1 [Zingiber officinale]